MKRLFTTIIILSIMTAAYAERFEPIKYGNMDNWVVRHIKESGVIGGKNKNVYAVGPRRVIEGSDAYVPQGGTPWASSNVMAKVAGVTKTSNAVYPEPRPGKGQCAKLTSRLESIKALGLVNIDVMVAGTLFLGRMFEPISSTSNPYSKMEMGVPFTGHPDALVYDYELSIPDTDSRIQSTGFSKKRTLPGHDNAEVIILLQRRWEDADGNLYARRVGTGHEILSHSTSGWQDGHHLAVRYGDISGQPGFTAREGLISKDKSYYARNSKGKMVPVTEVGWDSPDATPTHMIVMFSAGSGEPYVGTPGLTLKVDNVGLAYNN
ncbi:MAG: PCMD domain-containing protein [Muribaculaceae bacterium]|nr:PCMD domain-containing protein [Muribaculaceae bacterium]